MPYEHNLPEVLNPSGDIVVPLYIPHDADYTALLLGVVRTLEEVDRYERDPNYDNENAQIVAGNWRDRTITPLIEAIASGTGFPGMKITHVADVDLTANFTIPGTSYAAISGSGFNYSPTKPNMEIECHNIRISNSGNNDTRAKIGVHSKTPDSFSELVTAVADPREGMVVASYSGLTPGVSLTISLHALRAAGTGTISRYPFLTWIIRESD